MNRRGTRGWRAAAVVVLTIALLPVSVAAAQIGAPTTPRVAASSAKSDSLSGITCRHLSACWAVGYSGKTPSFGKTLIERWNTHHGDWRHVTSPNPSGMAETGLQGVACATSSACVAVGAGETAPPALVKSAVAEHWNGHKWKLTPLPLTARQPGSILWAASCANPSYCFAVGSYSTDVSAGDTAVLVFRWNGTHWSRVPAPSGFDSSEFFSVSCTSTTNCLAVGDYVNSDIGFPLTERWNGMVWSIVNPQNQVNSQSVQLEGISCTGGSHCLAVGNYYNGASLMRTFDERWTGFALEGKPKNPSPSHAAQLIGDACTSSSHCLAVGDQPLSATHTKTLAERWNGSTWKVLPTPSVGSSRYLTLLGVSCPGTTDCFAVGVNDGASPSTTLIERWNGHHWKVVTSPNP